MQEPATHRLLCTFCHTMLYQTLLVLPQAVYCAPWSVPPVTHTVCPFWAIPTIVLSSLVLVRTFVASSTFAHLPAQFSTWDSFSALTAIAVTELWAWAGTARVNVATITAVATAVLDLMQLKNLPMLSPSNDKGRFPGFTGYRWSDLSTVGVFGASAGRYSSVCGVNDSGVGNAPASRAECPCGIMGIVTLVVIVFRATQVQVCGCECWNPVGGSAFKCDHAVFLVSAAPK